MKTYRHYVAELDMHLSVVLNDGGLDAYREAFTATFPVPEQLLFVVNNPPDSFVDIGANIGQMALFAGALGIRTLAIEAVSENACLLCRGILANGFTHVMPCHFAASNAPGSLAFAGDSAWCHATAGPGQFHVPAMPVDDLLVLHGFTGVELVKIDVEGHELQTLEGMQKTIETVRPRIIIESNTWTHPVFGDYEAPLRFLRDQGYATFMYVGEYMKGDEDFTMQELCVADYYCIPREQVGVVPAPKQVELDYRDRCALIWEQMKVGSPHARHVAHMVDRFEGRFGRTKELDDIKFDILHDEKAMKTISQHPPGPNWLEA